MLYSVYERRLRRQLLTAQRPRHVGVILDGNRRWAREAGLLDVTDGHREGASRITDLLGWCREMDVEIVTLWLLSTDNLNRPDQELRPLLDIIGDVVDELSAPGRPWRVRVVGALDLLPEETTGRLTGAAGRTEQREGMQVNIAVGYGGRREIADAVRKLLLSHAETGTSIEELAEVLDVDHIAEHLYTSGQPDPTWSSGPPASNGCPGSCSGSRRTRSSGSARPTGRSSAGWISCARCATTGSGTGDSAPDSPKKGNEKGAEPRCSTPFPRDWLS